MRPQKNICSQNTFPKRANMRNQAARQGLFEHVFDIQSMKMGARSRTIAAPERHQENAGPIDKAAKDPVRARLKEQFSKAVGKAFPSAGLKGSATRTAAVPAVAEDSAECATTIDTVDDDAILTRRPSHTTSLKNLDVNQQPFSTERPPRNRRHSYACPSGPPREFFCPISKTLMTEPVTLLNTNVTLSRTALQAWLRTGSRVCPVTGQELSGWVAMESNEKLRGRVRAWATEQGLNFDLLDSAQALLAQWRGNAIAEADELVLSF